MSIFQDRTIIVTGGTGALGTAVVGQLLSAGAICHIPCMNEHERDTFPHARSDRARPVMGVDLSNEGQVVDFYNGVQKPLWASVHIAGGFSYGPIAEATATEFERQWRMNTLTCWLCCREAVKGFRKARNGGRIVNVAARPAVSPEQGANMTAYTAAKSAVAALTIALAAEVAPESIWVNAVAPSILDTPPNRSAMPKSDFNAWPKVEEVARTICFLASPENMSTRGGIVPVYGRA